MNTRADGNGALALRTLPHSLEAEKAVLGGIIIDNATFHKVCKNLRPEHFVLKAHGEIFVACRALIEAGKVADPITLEAALSENGALADAGGPPYIAELAHSGAGAIHTGQYVEIVRGTATKRDIIGMGDALITQAYDGGTEPTDILRDHAAAFGRLASECPDAVHIGGAIEGLIEPITLDGEPVPARRWLVDGWIPHGEVTVLAGDGGVGKSILDMQLLTCAAIGKDWLGQRTEPCKAIGIFCEDDADELHRRQDAINRHYGIGFADLQNMLWCCRKGQENALMAWQGFDAPGEITGLFSQVRAWAKDFGAQLIVFDALHDFFVGDENRRPHAR